MPEVPAPPRQLLRFNNFELDLQTGELRKAGVLVGLQDQSLKVLAELLQRPGELVTREELRQRLWPNGTFVDFDHGLNAVINRLRESLGDSADSPRFIQTVPRRGYRFIAPVEAASLATHAGSRTRATEATPKTTSRVAMIVVAVFVPARNGRRAIPALSPNRQRAAPHRAGHMAGRP